MSFSSGRVDDETTAPICSIWYTNFILPCAGYLWDLLPQSLRSGPIYDRPAASVSPMKMSVALQRKLGRGATYNLRLLIRGDHQTGKTQLWRRLQGLSFDPSLSTTRALGVVHLDWSCARSADVVKVEAWDVVDADLTARDTAAGGLKFEGSKSARSPRGAALDVWKGAHAVVCVFDPRKRWTFAYAQRLLIEAPDELPMLLLANFADLPVAEADAVAWSEVEQAANEETSRSGRRVVCVRGSANDCQGLAAVHAFIQLPYYELVRSSLATAQTEAEESLLQAEARVRAAASGEPVEEDSWVGPNGASGKSEAAMPPPMTVAAAPRATQTAGGLTFAAPAAQTTPKLAPPPPATPPPRAPASSTIITPATSQASASTSCYSNIQLGGTGASPAIESIDDSFFDGLDAPGAAPAPPPAPTPKTPPVPPLPPPPEDDGVEGLLPLLEDPDDE